jgi:hypothetical protein
MEAAAEKGEKYSSRIKLVHPKLLSWMGLVQDAEIYHDVQISSSTDPITLQGVYTISQIDVTDAVLAQHEVQAARLQLENDKVTQVLGITRQGQVKLTIVPF